MSESIIFTGTREERGLDAFRHDAEVTSSSSTDDAESKDRFRCYDLPLVMPFIRRVNWLRFVPICPTFSRKSKGNATENTEELGNPTEQTENGGDAVRYRKNYVSSL